MQRGFFAGLLVAVVLLLQGCAQPIRVQDIAFEGGSRIKVPIEGQLLIDMSPEERSKVYTVSHWTFKQGDHLYSAAQKVFGRMFRDVYGSDQSDQGNLVMTISGTGHVDIFWGTYTVNATAYVKLADGTNVGRFTAEGSEVSGMVNDVVAFENASIHAFRAIGEQMLNHPVLAGLVDKGLGAPVAVSVPLLGGGRGAYASGDMGQPAGQTAWMPAQQAKALAAAQAAPAASGPGPAAAAPINPDKKVALIIGNGAYREAPLRNPVNDARALSAKLRGLGFDVMYGENLGLRDMSRLVTRFGEKLAGKGVGLFYYAGHGMQVKGHNYLLPVDAQISSEASARSESIDLDQVIDHLNSSGSQFNLVILDACRNNPFERRFRSAGSGGLAQIDAPKGTLIAFATAPGKVAMDGDGENSTYTTALLRALSEPGLPVEAVFKRVRTEVSRTTADQQVPWESSSLTGDFYFLPAAARAAVEAKSPEAELLFWQSIKESSDVDDFNAYLKRYPDGQFADIARNRVKKLGGK